MENFDKDKKEQIKKTGIFKASLFGQKKAVISAESHFPPVPYEAVGSQLLHISPKVENEEIVCIRCYPKNMKTTEKIPTIFYLPGTAFTTLSAGTERLISAHLSLLTGCQVIALCHSLTEDAKYPKGYQDIEAAIYFLTKGSGAAIHCIDTKRIALVGYSSGGNYAVKLTTEIAQRGKIKFAIQCLLSPVLDLTFSEKGFDDKQNDLGISEKFGLNFLLNYLSPNDDRGNPKISPYWKDIEELANCPPTWICVAKTDRYYGDSAGFREKLIEAKVPTEFFECNNDSHTYFWRDYEVLKKLAARLTQALIPSSQMEPEIEEKRKWHHSKL